MFKFLDRVFLISVLFNLNSFATDDNGHNFIKLAYMTVQNIQDESIEDMNDFDSDEEDQDDTLFQTVEESPADENSQQNNTNNISDIEEEMDMLLEANVGSSQAHTHLRPRIKRNPMRRVSRTNQNPNISKDRPWDRFDTGFWIMLILYMYFGKNDENADSNDS